MNENVNSMIFDTETTSLEKPMCYNIGYKIVDKNNNTLCQKDFVIEQVWHNLPLFNSAYYANKRQLYVSAMRGKKAKLSKYGYVMREMSNDIKKYNVQYAFAFNSGFDERVFEYNCDWYKVNNPLDTIPVFDIRGYAHKFLLTKDFFQFCEDNKLFTENGNYSTTADTFGKYFFGLDFEEEHTALSDSILENEILQICVKKGAILGTDYKALKSIERQKEIDLIIKDKNNDLIFKTTCNGYTFYKTKNTIKIK